MWLVNCCTTNKRWNLFQAASGRVQKEHQKQLNRKKRRWQAKIVQEGTSSCRTLWASTKRRHPPLTESKTATEIKTHADSINQDLIRHFSPMVYNHKPHSFPTAITGDPMLDRPITRSEVKKTLTKRKGNKTKGADQIPNELLKKAGPTMIESITLLDAKRLCRLDDAIARWQRGPIGRTGRDEAVFGGQAREFG